MCSNCHSNVNRGKRGGDPAEWELEMQSISLDFEMLAVCEELHIAEWAHVEIIAVSFFYRRKPRHPEIAFTHIEIEEGVPHGTTDVVEEILAESLFNAWLSRKGSKSGVY